MKFGGEYMSDAMDKILNEKEKWGKVYTDIYYAIDNISPFLSEDFLTKKKFYTKVKVLKDYISLLEEEEIKGSKKGFFGRFSSPNLSSINSYRSSNGETFSQLENCSKCSCLNCVVECSFKSCTSCRRNSIVKSCDHKKLNIRIHDRFTLDLTNNDTGRDDTYKVLATLEDCIRNQEYIIIENIKDNNDKYILYLYSGIKEDTYGEITDQDEFNFIENAFETL